jgi:ABC-type phosphate/phosphonate transport system substrate-binding protein
MRRAYLAVALATIVGLGACGSSKKSTGSSTKELPSAQFAQKADAICTLENQKRKAFGSPPNVNPATASGKSLKALGDYLAKDSAVTKDEVARVSALGSPKDEPAKSAWPKLHTRLTTVGIPNYDAVVQAAQAGDTKRFQAEFKKLSAGDAEQTKLQKQIGLKVCGAG